MKDFIETFGRIMKHMKEKHPKATFFGDSYTSTLDGKVLSQKCQLCGDELQNENRI